MSVLSHLFTQHRMGFVLVALCALFSALTWTDQAPVGAEAGRAVVGLIQRQNSMPRVLVVVGGLPEDSAFAEAVAVGLAGASVQVVKGEPRDARQALKRLAAEVPPQPLDAIACTATTANWLALKDIDKDFPALGKPLIVKAATRGWPNFLKADNLLNIANQIAVIAILAVGMTLVIIAGGIDLSVGSLIALSAVSCAWMIREWFGGVEASAFGMIVACVLAVLLCGLAGATSGLLVTRFGLPPFIATLCLMLVGSGAAYMLAKGESVYQVPESFVWLGRGTGFFGLPIAVLLMLALYLAAHGLMAHTRLGRYIYAVGGNAEAALVSGVPVALVRLFTFFVSGALAGLGGVVMASQLKSGSPTYGQMYELYVIAAVVVGGTSLNGGRGRMAGTLTGAFIIAVIQNGMNLTNIESYTQKVVLGVVILLAVMADSKAGANPLRLPARG